jgi:hypothetical protein
LDIFRKKRNKVFFTLSPLSVRTEQAHQGSIHLEDRNNYLLVDYLLGHLHLDGLALRHCLYVLANVKRGVPIMDTIATYNGWSNRETWLVNLWLVNEESYYYEMQRILSAYTSLSDQASALCEFMQGEHEGLEVTGVWSDIIGNTLWRANWQEIAENNRE